MALAPHIASAVAHLWDATLDEVVRGQVAGRAPVPPMDRTDVERHDELVGGVVTRRYRPAVTSTPEPRHPETGRPERQRLVWVHGGGWAFGGLDMVESDSMAQVAVRHLGVEVVTVDYRLAPRHTHPDAVDDVVDVCRAIAASGPYALGGASAGAHLALLANARLDRETSPRALWLAYPVTEPCQGPWTERHPDCPPVLWLDRWAMGAMFARYLGCSLETLGDVVDAADTEGRPVVPRRLPLASLPPTLVTTAEVDGLAAQGTDFVSALERAGVDVAHHRVDGVLHGYLDTVGGDPLADAALRRHLHWLGAQGSGAPGLGARGSRAPGSGAQRDETGLGNRPSNL